MIWSIVACARGQDGHPQPANSTILTGAPFAPRVVAASGNATTARAERAFPDLLVELPGLGGGAVDPGHELGGGRAGRRTARGGGRGGTATGWAQEKQAESRGDESEPRH